MLFNRLATQLAQTYRYHRRSLPRATATSIAASIIDFGTLMLLVEVFRIYYVIAVAIGAFFGAITNFSLNRAWAFDQHSDTVSRQGVRYALVSGGSLLLNTGLVFCFTEFLHLKYLISKIIVAQAVGWGWNYPLHRYFVFRPSQKRS